MEGTNTIGTILYNLREKKGETLEQVAENVKVSYVSLCRYETGKRMPKMNILARLAKYYGVTVDSIIGEETKNSPPQGELSESVMRLFDEVQSAGLTDAEADYLRAQIAGIKALRAQE